MTITLVYGDATDGYLASGDAAYATARTGPADSVNAGSAAFYGQNNNGGTYTVLQTFLRFAYPAVAAGEVVAAASVRTYQFSQLSTGVSRDLELRSYAWSGGGLTTADWRTPTQLSAAALLGKVVGVQASQGKNTYAGSDALRAAVASGTAVELVLVSSRQRAGNTPTSDEGSSIYTTEGGGTTSDPLLSFTTFTLTAASPGLEVQLSDGSWVYGVRPGNAGWEPAVTLYRADSAGATTTIGTVDLGTTSTTWADVPAAQGLSLAVDSADNLYVVGRAGDAPNSLRIRAFVKGPGWAWTPGTVRTASLPAHDAPVNNVTTTWHSTAGGTLVVFASHAAGDGVAAGSANELAYALINSQYLLDGSGSLLRASGSALSAGLGPVSFPSGDFNGYANEVGSGLDAVADRSQADWGYVVSFKRGQDIGSNRAAVVGRYILNATATGFSHASYQEASAYGRKDASGKLRLLAVGSGQVAVVSADVDAGYGLSVQVLQASGTTPGFVSLGYVPLAAEGMASMPDGPAVASSLAWDAFYSTAENAVWVYYVDAANGSQARRTSVSLNTYQATRAEILVDGVTANPIRSIRTARNAWVTTRSQVVLGLAGGTYTRVADTLNLAPLAPTLTPKANYDATAAATFAWTFQDPNTGDVQTAYQLQVVRVSDGVTVLDTGKVLSATQSHNVAGGTLANGVDYRWRVTTWDAANVQGPWSDYGTFSTSAGGTVTITDPAVDNPPGIITDDYAVVWSVTGTVQTKFRAWAVRNDTGATVYDSGWLTDAFQGRIIRNMVSDVEHTISVQVENASAVRTNVATRKVTPSYGSPEVPLVTLTPVPEGGYVLVAVDNPIPQGDRPEVVRNRIFRRRSGTQDPWDDLGTCDPDGSFRDYTAPARIPLEYMVRGETA